MPQVTVVVEHAELLLTLHGDFSRRRAGCQYLRNGDPGYPEEPAEFELTDACLADGTSLYDLLCGTYTKVTRAGVVAYLPTVTLLETLALELLE